MKQSTRKFLKLNFLNKNEVFCLQIYVIMYSKSEDLSQYDLKFVILTCFQMSSDSEGTKIQVWEL